MYITFHQATNLIRNAEGKPRAKNPAYYDTFIYDLIRAGELERAEPAEFFVRNPDGAFESIGQIKTQALVSKQSVVDYINRRAQERQQRGCITKGGKPIEAIFSDGTKATFKTKSDAIRFFNVGSYVFEKALRTNTHIEVPLSKKRLKKIGVELEGEVEEITEFVKLRYA